MIAIVENRKQADFVINNRARFNDITLICFDEPLCNYIGQHRLRYINADAYAGTVPAEEVNKWARERSLTWFDQPKIKEMLEYDKINICDAEWHFIARNLVWIVRNYKIIHKIIEDLKPKKILVFYNQTHIFNRNYILKKISDQLNITCQVHSFGIGQKKGIDPRAAVKLIVSFAYGAFCYFRKNKLEKPIVVSGSLKHLSQAIEALKEKRGLIFTGGMFNRHQFNYCRQRKIPYIVNPGILPFRILPEFRKARKNLTKNIESVKNMVRDLDIFDYHGENIRPLLEILFYALGGRIKSRLRDIIIAKQLVKKYDPQALLIDEDIQGDSRARALVFRSCGIPVFVFSHGIPAHNHKISNISRPCGVDTTIVNSRFEKEKYCMLGWSADSTVVLGLPRYDALFRIKNNIVKSGNKNILYCPNCLLEQYGRPKFFNLQSNKYVIKKNTITILNAVKNIDCKLTIKPHFAHEMEAWRELLKEHGSHNITLVDSKEDIFALLKGTDLLITSFSSVIIEGLLLDKDIIIINFTGEPDLHPYAERGVAKGVYREEDLARTIKQCLFDDAHKQALANGRKKEFEYFCGSCDGKHAERDAEYVLSRIKNNERRIT